MTRQLSEILGSGEISSFNKGGTAPNNAVMDTGETNTRINEKMADGSITSINISGVAAENAVLNQGEIATYLSNNSFMFYAEDYDESVTYDKNAVVRDGDWLVRSNQDNNDSKAAPEAVGEIISSYPDDTNMVQTSLSAAYLLFGTRLIAEKTGFLIGFQVRLIAGNTYVVYYNENPSINNTLKTLVTSLTAQHTGWQTFSFSPKIYAPATVLDIIISEREVGATPTQYTANYNYVLQNSFSAPAAGEIVHTKGDSNILYINDIDADAIDQTLPGGSLESLQVGSVIYIDNMRWAVQEVSDLTTYLEVYIAPAIRLEVAALYECTFEDPLTTTLSYHIDTDHNLGNANVRGLFISNGNYIDIVENDNQYGVRALYKDAYVSEKWDILAYSGSAETLTSGSGQSLQEQINDLNDTVASLLSETYVSGIALGPTLSIAEIEALIPAEHPSRFLIQDPTRIWIVVDDGSNYYYTEMVIAV